jgi:uncharacterized membrane protein (DUF485 family)
MTQQPLPPGSSPAGEPAPGHSSTGPDWETFQQSPEFGRLRRAVRRFVFPTTVAFLAWYVLYVLLVAYARPFMNTKVFGNINVGLIFGLLQFVSTFAIAIVYARYADRKMDPLAAELRPEIEGSAR